MSYAEGFSTFLKHSTQRDNLYRWFETLSLNPKTFLSIGSGTGEVEYRLVNCMKERPEVTLVEPNSRLLEKCSMLFPEAELHHSTFINAPLTGRKFDLILLSHCLYYFSDPKSVIDTCYNMLNPDGKLMIVNETREGIHYLRLFCGGYDDMLISDEHVAEMLSQYQVEKFYIDGIIDRLYLQDMLSFIIPKTVLTSDVVKAVLHQAKLLYGDNIPQPSIVFMVEKVEK